MNGSDDDEIAGSITAAMHDSLELALGGALHERLPAQPEKVFALVTSIVALIGQNWPHAGRSEYIAAVCRELVDYPGEMVIDALTRARRCVTDGRQLVKWLCEDIDPRATALQVEIERYSKLAQLAVAKQLAA